MGRILYDSIRQLKLTARTFGAKPVSTIFIGLASGEKDKTLSERQKKKIRSKAKSLIG